LSDSERVYVNEPWRIARIKIDVDEIAIMKAVG
jgi:hypothetical protein